MAKGGGKPRFASAEEFQAEAEAYFTACNKKKKPYGEAGLALHLGVTLRTLRSWYDGERCKKLQDAVQMAYLRIQDQIETGAIYRDKGMANRAIFMLKQPRFGGYQDRNEMKQDITFSVKLGKGMDKSDFL